MCNHSWLNSSSLSRLLRLKRVAVFRVSFFHIPASILVHARSSSCLFFTSIIGFHPPPSRFDGAGGGQTCAGELKLRPADPRTRSPLAHGRVSTRSGQDKRSGTKVRTRALFLMPQLQLSPPLFV